MREGFNQMFFGDGTGNSGKNWNGLGNIIESGNTLGGINSATGEGNNWWRSYEENTAGALTLAQMSTAYNSVSVGNDHPDMVLTTQTLFEKYESLLQPQLRYTDTKTAESAVTEIAADIEVVRAGHRACFPARFQLVGAMNPCPCGWRGHPTRPCRCTPEAIARYQARLSGPLLDRIDLQVEVPALGPRELVEAAPGEGVQAVRLGAVSSAARRFASRSADSIRESP